MHLMTMFITFVSIVLTSCLFLPASGQNVQGDCLYGWVDGGANSDNCYYFSTNLTLNWTASRDYCTQMSADLLSVLSASDWAFIKGQLTAINKISSTKLEIWWYGLNRIDKSNPWMYSDGNNETYKLTWLAGNPKDKHNYAYIFFYGFYKMSGMGDTKRNFVCKRSKSIVIPCDTENGWDSYGVYCYKAKSTQRTWAEARRDCQIDGADLSVVLKSETDKNILRYTQKNKQETWIGLKSSKTTNGFEYKFWNGSSTNDYSSWGINNNVPDSGQEDNTCVYMKINSQETKTWSTATCDQTKPYVCQKDQGRCAPGWNRFLGKCYYFGMASYDFVQSNTFCQSMGAELMNVKSNDTQSFLLTYLPNFKALGYNFLWIGLRQQTLGSDLEWTTGGKVSAGYQNWALNQPILSTKQANCVRLDTDSTGAQWSVADDCLEKNAFMCEIPLHKLPQQVTTTAPTLSCDDGWLLYESMCYFFNDTAMEWLKSQDTCRSQGADLVDIRTAREQSFIRTYYKSRDRWIGLNDRIKEGSFVWNNEVSSLGPVDFTYWAPGEPNDHNNQENCVHIRAWDSQWNDMDCKSKYSFICKKHANRNGITPSPQPTLITPRWSPKCGLNWESDQFSDFCYLFNVHTLSWQDANTDCSHYGGQLVSILSENEKRFIAGRISSMTNVIGFWTGFQNLKGWGNWEWYDRSPIVYLNWAPGKPTNNGGSCSVIYQQNLQWDQQKCQARYGFICKKVGVVDPTTPPPSTVSPTPPPGYVWGCPPGYDFYSSTRMCYGVFKESLDFSTAQQRCRKSGGELASITSSSENSFIGSRARSAVGWGNNVWIGLYDSIKNSATMNFMWTDGSKVTYTNWNSGEPNNWGKNEDCVELYSWGFTWNDNRCDSTPAGYACKAKQLPVLVPQTEAPLIGCPSQSKYDSTNNGACYKFVKGSAAVTWSAASSTCQSYGAQLSSILNSDEQAFIGGALKDFGLTDDDAWFGLNRGSDGFLQWSNGDYLSWRYSHWAKLSNRALPRGLLHTNNTHMGLWNMNSNDFTLKNFICKAPQNLPTTTPLLTTFDPSQCVTGWIDDGEGFCYKAYTAQTDRILNFKSWMDARAHCQSVGGDLASIHNLTLNNLLKSQMISGRTYWIGLNMRDTRDNGEGHVWSDGQGFNFENWAPNQPDDLNGAKDCVTINFISMKWSDEVCESTQNWICKVKRGIQPTGSPPTPPPPLPPCFGAVDWVSYNDSCYFVGSQATLNWATARRMCILRGGDLASITDINENKMLLSQVNKFTSQEVWIGLHELGVNAAWQWVNDDPVSFTNWAKGEPNNWGGAEHCVTFSTKSGYWNDNHCDRSFPYICKKMNGTTTRKPLPRYTNAPGNCPQYFHEMGNKCVRLFNDKTDLASWVEARDKCSKLGTQTGRRMYLTSVANQFETGVISSLLLNSEVNIWIGLYRLERNGWQFVWTDNSEFRYTNWAVNEPNGRNTGENCVELYRDQFKVGTWNDISCDAKRGYACMTFKDINLATAWPSPGLRQCPDGWVPYMQACYYYEKSPSTYSEALINCQNKKADLVSIHDEYEHQFVFGIMHDADLMYSPSWIGLNDRVNRGTFEWTDKWPVTYTLWGYRQPQDLPGTGCVAMFPYTTPGGQFYNMRCDARYNSVCKITNEAKPKPTVGLGGGCLNSWYPFGNNCYYFAVNRFNPQSVMKTWGDARIDCQQRHTTSDLASIEDKGVQDFLMRKLKELMGISSNQADLWIGLLLQNGGGFGWADKSPLSFINWAPGEPNSVNISRSEDCVEMYWRDGQWNDENCRTLNSYVCKMPMIVGATLPPTTQPVTPSSGVITPKPPVTQGNLGTQPTARPNQLELLLLSRKNNSLVTGILIFFIALLVLAAGGIVFYRSFFKSSGDTTMESVAYVRGDDKVKVDKQKDVDFTSFENPNAQR